MLDGSGQELGLRREVVELGAARHAGAARGLGRSGGRVAEIDQALDRRVEQSGSGRDAALLDGHWSLIGPLHGLEKDQSSLIVFRGPPGRAGGTMVWVD